MKKWILSKEDKTKDLLDTDELNISEEIRKILLNRKIFDTRSAKEYINPAIEYLRDPFLLKDMDRAVERIKMAIAQKEKICIYGDYDVDGVSSTSILMIYFKSIGYPVEYYIPNRLEEGYGINIEAVNHLKGLGINLVVTVDCGITSVNEVEYANSIGIDVIVTDHHECQEVLPNACAVVDPKRPDCTYPFESICGCTVALKLIHALSGNAVFMATISRYLEIVSLATICDVMPALDENRIIVKNGLEIFGSGSNCGIKALVKVCGLEGNKIRSSDLGFQVGPRINAAGRLGFSELGVELLTEESQERADFLADLMDLKNTERQSIEARIYNDVEDIINSDKSYNDDKIIVIGGEDWHHGIIGIVASKITEKYYKPCILMCIEGGVAVGSARSIKGFNLFKAMNDCKELMTKFGGHEQAAGLTMDACNIEELRKKINKIANYDLTDEDLVEKVKIDLEIDAERIDLEFVDSLHVLEPFGIKNPTPLFLLRDCIVKKCNLIGRDKKHLKLEINKVFDFEAIGFGMSHLAEKFSLGDHIDIVFQLSENNFNGQKKVQLMIKDIKLNKPTKMLDNGYITKKVEESINFNVESSCEIDDFSFDILDLIESKTYSDKELRQIKSIIDKNVERYDNVNEAISENTLLVYNTISGYFRAKSDISTSDIEKIDHIFLSNIDKMPLKRYNKIIIYDYIDNISQIAYIIENKGFDCDLVLNFNYGDFIQLKMKRNEMDFQRDEFVVVYKRILGIKDLIVKYGDFIASVNLTSVKVIMILKVLKDEEIIDYEIDYVNNEIKFKVQPMKGEKLDLQKNKIIKKIKNQNDLFKKTYSI